MGNEYDIIIVGGGPAGMTAGLYASRARMSTLLLEKEICGGQILITDTIENYPGFPDGIKGPDLAEWMRKQAEHFGLETVIAGAESIDTTGQASQKRFVVNSSSGVFQASSLIIASGAHWNTLNVPGEEEFRGRGVSYCATCDGPLFKNKEIIVVGGGDTAIEDALYLAKFANKITIVHRRDRLRATKILQERALSNKKIEMRFNSVVIKVVGKKTVEGAVVKDVVTGAESELKGSGVFVFIGMSPNSGIVKDKVQLDDKGYIICDDSMNTSMEGIFACGDVRKKSLRQVVTAAGDGASAAFSAQHYVERIRGSEYK